jgi:hypothetical protein
MTVPHVFEAIASVMADLSAEGISKSRKNQQQGYSFRGIDEVYNALSSVLAKHKLVITPRALARTCEERQTKSGGALFYVTVDMEFVLTSAVDGSTVTARTFGEAMDNADKATNKAMSAAYKYMAMQQFCIPTEGDNDADGHTPDVASRKAPDYTAAIASAKTAIDLAADLAALRKWRQDSADLFNKLDTPSANEVIRHMNARVETLKAEMVPA